MATSEQFPSYNVFVYGSFQEPAVVSLILECSPVIVSAQLHGLYLSSFYIFFFCLDLMETRQIRFLVSLQSSLSTQRTFASLYFSFWVRTSQRQGLDFTSFYLLFFFLFFSFYLLVFLDTKILVLRISSGSLEFDLLRYWDIMVSIIELFYWSFIFNFWTK